MAPPPDRAEKPSQRRRRRWKRRILWGLGVLVSLTLLLRIALALSLPSLLDRAFRDVGLACSYERLRLSLLGGDLELWYLDLAPAAGGDDLVELEYCRADLAMLPLLAGRLVVRRLEVDGLDLAIDRRPDGSVQGFEELLATVAAFQSEPEPKEGFPLEPPLAIDALRLQHLRVRLRDAAVSPPVEVELDFTLRLSNFGSRERRTRFSIDAAAPPLLGHLSLEGQGAWTKGSLELAAGVRLRGLDAQAFSGYLEGAGARGLSRDLALDARARLEAARGEDGAVAFTARLEGLSVRDGGNEDLALGALALEGRVLPPRIEVTDATLRGGTARPRRLGSGELELAGIAFAPRSGDRREPPPEDRGAGGDARGEPERWIASVARLQVESCRLEWSDAAVAPPVALGVELESLSLERFSNDPEMSDVPATIRAAFRLGELAESVRLAGEGRLGREPRAFDLEVDATGIDARVLGPYLAPAGIEPIVSNGRFSCAIHAELSGSRGTLAVRDLTFAGEKELLGLDRLEVSGAGIDGRRIAVDAVAVEGTRLDVERGPGETIELLGLRFKSRATRSPAGAPLRPAAPGAPASDVAAHLPALEVGRFLWRSGPLRFRDRTFDPAVELEVRDAGLDIEGLSLDPARDDPAEPPARMSAWLAAPGLAGELRMRGSLAGLPLGLRVEADIEATEITGHAAVAYLHAAGLEPRLTAGRLHVRAEGEVRARAEGAAVSLSIEDVTLEDGGSELAGLDALAVEDARLEAGSWSIGSVVADRPRARARRGPRGDVTVAGIGFVERPRRSPASAPRAETASTASLRESAGGASPAVLVEARAAEGAAGTAPAVASGAIPSFSLGTFRVREAALDWSDASVEPAVALRPIADIELRDLEIGGPDDAALEVSIAVPGVLEGFFVAGKLRAGEDGAGARVDIDARGFRPEALSSLLPDGISAVLRDGRLRASVQATGGRHAAGGHWARIELSDVAYGESGSEPCLAFERAQALVSRLDPAAGVVAIEDLSVLGLAGEASRTADGGIELLGLRLRTPSAPEAPAPAVAPLEAEPLPPPSRRDGQRRSGAASREPPLVRVDRLLLDVRQLRLLPPPGEAAAPIAVSGLRLANRRPIELLGREPDARPPVELELETAIEPFVERLGVTAELSPFASRPALELEWKAEGIRGSAPVEAFPELAAWIDGSGLERGAFQGRLELAVDVRRRHALDLEFLKSFGAEVLLRGIEFRNEASGEKLLGAGEVLLEVAGIDTSSGAVHIKSLEVRDPFARGERTAEGWRVLDLLIHPPAPHDAGDAPPAPAPAPQPVERRPEVKVDELLVTGCDISFLDRSVTPELTVPLQELDIAVRSFTTRTFDEHRPFRIHVAVNADKVTLPERVERGFIGGVLSGAGKLVGVGDGETRYTERPLFEQISAGGVLALGPTPSGWLKLGVSALELAAFKGIAAAGGVKLEDGTLDGGVDLRFHPSGSIDVESRFIFTGLDLSEPAGGPIYSYLKLPAPLDAVLFVLRDEAGALEVPLSFEVSAEGNAWMQIPAVAASTLSSLAASAIKSSPFRLIGTVGELVLPSAREEPGGEVVAALPFGPASAALGASALGELGRVAEQLEDDGELAVTLRHELGSADVTMARVRANPSHATVLDLATRLRQRKEEILTERARVAGLARTAYGARRKRESAVLTERIRELDRELGQTEAGLDQVLDLLRPGADRQAVRRTRDACLAMGRARLEEARRVLAEAGVPIERVRIVRPRADEGWDGRGGRVTLTLSRRKAP